MASSPMAPCSFHRWMSVQLKWIHFNRRNCYIHPLKQHIGNTIKFSMHDKSKNIWRCGIWQWTTRGWCYSIAWEAQVLCVELNNQWVIQIASLNGNALVFNKQGDKMLCHLRSSHVVDSLHVLRISSQFLPTYHVNRDISKRYAYSYS